MSKKVEITGSSILPDPEVNVALNETVEITATEKNCVVMLGFGVGVKLKKNQTVSVVATTEGHHPFQVFYESSPTMIRESVSISEEQVGGVAVATASTLLAASTVTAGPIGDIHV